MNTDIVEFQVPCSEVDIEIVPLEDTEIGALPFVTPKVNFIPV